MSQGRILPFRSETNPTRHPAFSGSVTQVERLALNDASVSVRREPPRAALGMGLRLGFLGLLHLDVFRQRLQDEFEENVLFTAPLVPYRLRRKGDETLDDSVSLIDDSVRLPNGRPKTIYISV